MCEPNERMQKWTCDYCTYENFHSSIKCTMCKAAKPSVNEDIFRLSPPQTTYEAEEERGAACYTHNSKQQYGGSICAAPPATASAIASDKWACKICTYLNWPRSLRCVQCCTKRGISTLDLNAVDMKNEVAAENTKHEKDETDHINASTKQTTSRPASNEIKQRNKKQSSTAIAKLAACAEYSAAAQSSDVGAMAEAVSSFAQSSNNTQQHKRANSKQKTQQQQQQSAEHEQQTNCSMPKWTCIICTYENWPKSLKCAMCGQARENTRQEFAPLGENDLKEECERENNASCISNKLLIENENASNDKNVSVNNCFNKKHIFQLGSSETINNCDTVQERQERRQRQIRRQVDWQWLNACLGVVENNYSAVEAYLSCGGNPARSLTSNEIAALNRNSAFDVGHTLIHLAIRFHREEMLPMLLSQISSSGPGIKRVPSYVAPDLASDIRRHFSNMLRIRKSVKFSCHYVQEHATFTLPTDIEELPVPIQEQLYDELLDRDAQKQLETPPPALNWSLEITARLGSRLMVLWNRSAGDCLLDSAMQATWGVFDRDNTLRRALADSLLQCAPIFYQRWKEYEMLQASMLNFTLEETQWQEDWRTLLNLAGQPGSSLEQLHIFALAHILRRPIIVYGVKYVKSFRGEDIGFARFEGLYLPLLWDQNFCIKSPIALGYTRGHFSALVPMEPYAGRIDVRGREEPENVTFLPLMDCESKLLPIHFLSQTEIGSEEAIMREWLEVCVTDGGLLVAQQKLRKRPLLVAQMLEEWLNHYRRIAQLITAPFARRPQQTGYSSDGDSDEE